MCKFCEKKKKKILTTIFVWIVILWYVIFGYVLKGQFGLRGERRVVEESRVELANKLILD